jgi:hypothetical protein
VNGPGTQSAGQQVAGHGSPQLRQLGGGSWLPAVPAEAAAVAGRRPGGPRRGVRSWTPCTVYCVRYAVRVMYGMDLVEAGMGDSGRVPSLRYLLRFSLSAKRLFSRFGPYALCLIPPRQPPQTPSNPLPPPSLPGGCRRRRCVKLQRRFRGSPPPLRKYDGTSWTICLRRRARKSLLGAGACMSDGYSV